MKINSKTGYRWVAIAYLVLVTILFLLPGSALPKENWFDTIRLDKLIHVFLFAFLIFLWAKAFDPLSRITMIYLAGAAILYGILIELSQELFVPNRSMDIFDIIADIAGVFAGIWWLRPYKKNKPL
jgi:VanZ family protein